MSRTKWIFVLILISIIIIGIATRAATGPAAGAIRAGVVGVLLLGLFYLVFITKVREPLDTIDHLTDE